MLKPTDPQKEEMDKKIKIIRQQMFNDRLRFLKTEISAFVIGESYSEKQYEEYKIICDEYENLFTERQG